MTPIQQGKFQHSVTSSCWRECGEQYANYSHFFWFCPVLTTYWTLVCNGIRDVLKHELAIDHGLILLGKVHGGTMNSDDKYLIRIMRAAALKLITKNWLRKVSPGLVKWRELMEQIKEMEKLTYKIRGNPRNGQILWIKWENYMENRKANNIN